jgi:HEAT repeat protein
MRLWAGIGLLGLKHPQGLATLVEILGTEHQETKRRHAVDALGKYGERDVVPFLIQSLGDPDVEEAGEADLA